MSSAPQIDLQAVLGTVAQVVSALGEPELDEQELLQHLVEESAHVMRADNAGVIVHHHDGSAALVAVTAPEAGVSEMLQITEHEGPCIQAYRTGEMISVGSAAEADKRWPEWSAARRSYIYESVLAAPFVLDGHPFGTINFLSYQPNAFGQDAFQAASRLGHVVAVVLLANRRLSEQEALTAQLQHALDSRVAIEQAKGIIAGSRGVTLDEAFAILRAASRSQRRPMRELARQVIETGDVPDR